MTENQNIKMALVELKEAQTLRSLADKKEYSARRRLEQIAVPASAVKGPAGLDQVLIRRAKRALNVNAIK